MFFLPICRPYGTDSHTNIKPKGKPTQKFDGTKLLMEKIVPDNEKLMTLTNYKTLLQAG